MIVRHTWTVALEGDPAAVDDIEDWLIGSPEFVMRFGVVLRMTDERGSEVVEP